MGILKRHAKFRDFINQATMHPDHFSGNWRQLSRLICSSVSKLANVQRVGAWEFRDGGETLASVWVYDSGTNEYTSGATLKMSDFPKYAKAVTENRALIANDVYSHPSTQEFCPQYFPAFGITSMLDSAIYNGEQLLGILCLEHVGPQTDWSPDVQNLSSSLADLISNSFLIHKNIEGQQQLLMKSKLASIGEMSADLLHEVANPLQALEGVIQFCRLEIENQNYDSAMKLLSQAEKASQRVATVFHSMRNLMSRDDELLVSCSLKDILEDIDVVLGQRLRHNKIDIRIPEHLAEVQINCLRSGTSQVLLNLVSNAIDAIQDLNEKWIKIDYTFDGGNHRIVVTDSGSGIPAEVRSQMFGALFSTKKNKKGTGIGLALCRKLIEKQGGKLDLLDDSKHTAFAVTLPKAA